MKKIRKAVFPVGGLGTRFLPATKSMPKEMLPVVSKPLIHYAFEEARDAGIEQFIFVTGRNKSAINNHFDHAYEIERTLDEANKQRELEATRDFVPDAGNIMFIRQQQPAGLGHAIWCARHAIGDEPFVVILADDLVQSEQPCIGQLVRAAEEKPDSHIVAVMDVPKADTRKYGILDIDREEGRLVSVRGLVEKPAPEDAPSTLSIIGRYVLQPRIFDVLANAEKGRGGEIQITDAIAASMPETPVYGYRFEGHRFDCGEHAGFVEANLAYALADPALRPRIEEFLSSYCGLGSKAA